MKRVHVWISGNVQGVCFRAFVQERADSLDVKGWAMNTADAKVEAVFEGKDSDVDSLVELCNVGPILSEVSDVEVKEEEFTGEFDGFDVRH